MTKCFKKRKSIWRSAACLGLAAAVLAASVSAQAAESVVLRPSGELLSIDEAVRNALKDSSEIKRALARLGKEEALYKGTLAEFYPKIKADVQAGAATGERTFLSYLDTGIEQPIFQGGKAVAEKKRQSAVYEVEKLRLEEVKLDLELAVRVLHAQVLAEKELTRIAQGEVKELTAECERIKKLSGKEVLPRFEAFKVEAHLESVKHSLVQHKETYDYLLTVLRETVGIGEGEVLELQTYGSIQEVESGIESFLDASRETDPVYKEGSLMILAKQQEKRSLQAERFPQLSLSTRWNSVRDVYVDTNRVIVGIEGKWNIWDFGRLGSKIRAKEREIEETKWTEDIRIRDHEKEIRRLFHEARALRQKIRMTDAFLKENQESYKNEKTRLVTGGKGAGELLDSFIALEEARSAAVQAIAEYRIQMARLERTRSFKPVAVETFLEKNALDLEEDRS
jgi:outer membrane protein TolC